jgi:hypothetical protein
MSEQNKYNCDTCDHLSKKDYPAGRGYCLKSKSGYLMESRRNISLKDFVAEVGCASHSNFKIRDNE